MGLDQYLAVKKYVSPVTYSLHGMEPDAEEIERTLQLNSIVELAGAPTMKLNPETRNFSGIYIEQIMIQWRKQYAVQDWFEQKLGEMVNCRHYPIEREWLEELRTNCGKILEKIVWSDIPDQWGRPQFISIDAGFASTLVPIDGSSDYDEWYAYGIKQTKDGLDKILDAPDLQDAEFEYHGWW